MFDTHSMWIVQVGFSFMYSFDSVENRLDDVLTFECVGCLDCWVIVREDVGICIFDLLLCNRGLNDGCKKK